MNTQTSKTPTTTSHTANQSTATGKNKAPSGLSAPSLQDVFPESANAIGSHQETLATSDTGQEKGAQLKKVKGHKEQKINRGGRRKLHQKDRRLVKLQLHVTHEEYEKLQAQFQTSGQRHISEYLRRLVLDHGKTKILINKSALIRQLDKIGTDISRIGNNINQLAKYANIQHKTGKTDQRTMARFNRNMEKYLLEQQELAKAYRALVRGED